MEEGAEKARESARQTIEQARELIGLNYLLRNACDVNLESTIFKT